MGHPGGSGVLVCATSNGPSPRLILSQPINKINHHLSEPGCLIIPEGHEKNLNSQTYFFNNPFPASNMSS